MILGVLAALVALVAVFSIQDAWMTLKIIRRYGIGVELNGLIRWLAKYLGVPAGVVLGIAVPRTAIISLAWRLNCPAILAVLVVLQLLYAQKQLRVHWGLVREEKQHGSTTA